MFVKVKIVTVSLLIALMVGAAFISCSEDIVLPPLPTLLGEYEGRYHITTGLGTNPVTKTYDISWRFSDQNYWMTSISDGLCSPSGSYTYTDKVTLGELYEGCSGVVAKQDDNPDGDFSIRQPGDSVIMEQIVNDISKRIELVKKAE